MIQRGHFVALEKNILKAQVIALSCRLYYYCSSTTEIIQNINVDEKAIGIIFIFKASQMARSHWLEPKTFASSHTICMCLYTYIQEFFFNFSENDGNLLKRTTTQGPRVHVNKSTAYLIKSDGTSTLSAVFLCICQHYQYRHQLFDSINIRFCLFRS